MRTGFSEAKNIMANRLVKFTYSYDSEPKQQALRFFGQTAIRYSDMFYTSGLLKSPLVIQAEGQGDFVQLQGKLSENTREFSNPTFHLYSLHVLHGYVGGNSYEIILSNSGLNNLHDADSFDSDIVRSAEEVVRSEDAIINPIQFGAYGVKFTSIV